MLAIYFPLHSQFARFRHITAENGLSQNASTCIIQDKKGFIWIGTFNGLNKYDGIKTNVIKGTINEKDTNVILSSSIKCLYNDDEDNLFAGTNGGGMARLNLKTGKVTNFMRDSLRKNWINCNTVTVIKEYELGKLYIATIDGLYIFDKKTETFTEIKNKGANSIPFPTNNIRCMTRDTRGHIWFSHVGAGITEYDPKTKKCNFYTQDAIDPNKKINSNNVRNIFADSKGLIWVSCWNIGSNIIDTKTGKVYNGHDTTNAFKCLRYAALVSQFYEDRKGNIWFATAEHGLGRFEVGTYNHQFFENNKDDPESISDNTVFNIMEDNSGLIWAGTWKGGISILDTKTLNFGLFKHESNNTNSLFNNNVFCFCEKSKDETYIGTGGGVSIFNNRTKQLSQLPHNEALYESIKNNSLVYAIYKETDGSLWIGSGGGGLYRYFPDKNKYLNYNTTSDPNSFSHHSPCAVIKDKKNQLWFATTGGGLNLYHPDKDNFTRVLSEKNNENSLTSNFITSVVMQEDGKFWVATGDNGLNLFDPETKKTKRYLTDENNQPLFPDIAIASLFIDKNKNLWVGTTSGLCLFNLKTKIIKSYLNLHPIFTSLIYGIEQDNDGNIWFSTAMGLCKFNPLNLSYKVYSTFDGLQGTEFCLRAAHKTTNGKLFFGGLKGFNTFYPNLIASNEIAPGVVLTGFTVLNKEYKLPLEISYVNEIDLTYKDYFFSLDFASLDFTDPKKNNYEYKLEGFNDDWVEIGNKHSVMFTNLDPGEYTLLVKGSNNDGVWSKEPVKIKINITPPFWRTKWFYLLCLLTVILLIYLFIKSREQKLKQEKAILENKVEERTTELKVEKLKVESAHKDIKDSIQYAKKIQEAILPVDEELNKHLKDYFILYKPKDIVAGDFYWMEKVRWQKAGGNRQSAEENDPQLHTANCVLIAAADCTGHGVPGAFMSMIGSTFLNEIVRKGIFMPDIILDELNIQVRQTLKQDSETSQSRDGMDIALCLIDKEKNKLFYSGANRPCLIVRDKQIFEYKADKFPIGGIHRNQKDKFTLNEIEIKTGDLLYLFSDGYADQFGGPKGKKFMHKKLKETLISISQRPISEQKLLLDNIITNWRGNTEQIDDVLVIGILI